MHPDEQPLQAGVRDGIAGDAGDVVEPATEPEVAGVAGEDQEPEEDGGRERHRRHHRGASSPGEHQVDDEQGRGELDACDDADAYTGPPARVRSEQVGDHDGEDQQVHLPELQRQPYRFEPAEQAGEQCAQAPQPGRGRHPEPDQRATDDVDQQCGVHDEPDHPCRR
ncbi:hypothetical protein ASD37_01250 [Mycobacterium sp. Root135]|nr:hypothetical protein ASD37_01250 [Mycobacterium sp. Root135]